MSTTTEPELIRYWGSAAESFTWLVKTRAHGTVQVATATVHTITWDDHHEWGVTPETAALILEEALTVHRDLAAGTAPSIDPTHRLRYGGSQPSSFERIGDTP